MSKEKSIVDQLISKKNKATGLNESLSLTMFESKSSYIGKTFEVAADLRIDNEQTLDEGKLLFVKESTDGKFEIEVRHADGTVLGLMTATEAAFEQLVQDKTVVEVTNESLHTIEEATKTDTVVPELAKAIANEDFETAEKLFDKLPEGEDVYEALVSEVSKVASVSKEDASDLVDEFSDYLNLESEDDDEDLDEKFKKVVRNGQVVRIKVPTRKKRLSAKRRMALVKARRKAHTSSANRNRRKSMIVRKRRIKESFDMLKAVQSVFEEGGVPVIDADMDSTNEGLSLELTLDNSTPESYEINLNQMEAHFSEQFSADVSVDIEYISESKSAVVKFLVK